MEENSNSEIENSDQEEDAEDPDNAQMMDDHVTSNYVSTLRNPSFGPAYELDKDASPVMNQTISREHEDVEMADSEVGEMGQQLEGINITKQKDQKQGATRLTRNMVKKQQKQEYFKKIGNGCEQDFLVHLH